MQKNTLLNTLEILNSTRTHPLWIIGGDFKMINRLEEKLGGKRKLDNESNNFKEYIQNNWLIDLPFDNGGDICTSILPIASSDQWPISLQWKNPGNSNRKPFKFEAFSLTHLQFKNMVKSAWESFIPNGSSTMYKFQQRLKHIKRKIKAWNYTTFGNIFQEKKVLEKSMRELQQKIIRGGRTEELVSQEQVLLTQLEERRKQEELLWKPKSRIRWLKEGEKNTKFFHRTTMQRRINNTISHIQNPQGDRMEKQEEIEKELTNHFKTVHQ
eukprot:PITA_22559